MRAEENLEHPQRWVVWLCFFGVPEAASGVHYHQVIGIRHQFVALSVGVSHHSLGYPGDDFLVSMLMHRDGRSRVKKGLHDHRKRPVAVIIVLRDGPARKIAMNPELSLIL
jgi:hypothetical protein